MTAKVHDPGPVHGRQALGNLPRHGDAVRHRHPAFPPQAGPERLAGIQRHGEEEQPLCAFADFMDRAEVRVIESPRGAGLQQEPRFRRRVQSEPGQQELQGNRPSELGILRAVHHAHAAGVERLVHLEVRDTAAGQSEWITAGHFVFGASRALI